jgi:hypothetical protein
MEPNKPKIKVNFMYYENPFDLNKNWIYKILEKHFDVIISDYPDYVFFSVYKENNQFLLKDGSTPFMMTGKKDGFLKEIYKKLLTINSIKSIMWHLRDKGIVRPYAQMLELKGDFVKIFYTCESITPDMSKCDWAFGFDYEDKINNPRYFRIPPYVYFAYNFILANRKIGYKTRFCNFIYNNHVPFRNHLFKELNKYKHIDSPGKCMNNMPAVSYNDTNKSRSADDWEIQKINFIHPYKFSIACENRIKEGYNTDRIIHSYLGGNIPIYYGDPKIENDFNPKCFINLNGCKSYDEAREKIRRIDTDDKLYAKMLNQPLLNKDAEYNFISVEKKLLSIFI